MQFEEVADQNDLIGADDTPKKGFMSNFTQKKELKNRQTVPAAASLNI